MNSVLKLANEQIVDEMVTFRRRLFKQHTSYSISMRRTAMMSRHTVLKRLRMRSWTPRECMQFSYSMRNISRRYVYSGVRSSSAKQRSMPASRPRVCLPLSYCACTCLGLLLPPLLTLRGANCEHWPLFSNSTNQKL